jgi:hypothetical protein
LCRFRTVLFAADDEVLEAAAAKLFRSGVGVPRVWRRIATGWEAPLE